MKKSPLLNSALSAVIAEMGHFQTITICDAGLPIPKDVRRIDLAVCKGTPDFLTVLDTVLTELCVQKVTLAEEIKTVSPAMHEQILARFEGVEKSYVPHEQFKAMSRDSLAIVRTGETTSYTNIILESGVTF